MKILWEVMSWIHLFHDVGGLLTRVLISSLKCNKTVPRSAAVWCVSLGGAVSLTNTLAYLMSSCPLYIEKPRFASSSLGWIVGLWNECKSARICRDVCFFRLQTEYIKNGSLNDSVSSAEVILHVICFTALHLPYDMHWCQLIQ